MAGRYPRRFSPPTAPISPVHDPLEELTPKALAFERGLKTGDPITKLLVLGKLKGQEDRPALDNASRQRLPRLPDLSPLAGRSLVKLKPETRLAIIHAQILACTDPVELRHLRHQRRAVVQLHAHQAPGIP